MNIPVLKFAPHTLRLNPGLTGEFEMQRQDGAPGDGFAELALHVHAGPHVALGDAGFAAFVAHLPAPEFFVGPLPTGILPTIHTIVAVSQTLGSTPLLAGHAAGFAGSAIAAAPPIGVVELTAGQVAALGAGLSQSLSSLQANLVAQVFAEKLPIVGDNLSAAANGGAAQLQYVTTLKSAIVSGLGTLSGSGPYSEAQVEGAINGAISAAGIGGGGDLDLSNAADVKLYFGTAKNYAALTVPVEADLGLPNLGVSTSGNAQTTLNYRLNFTAGLDGAGTQDFYINTVAGQFFSIVPTITLPSFSENATLSGLKFTATDNAATPTNFGGTFNVFLKEPSGDGRLRVGELNGDLLDASLGAASTVNLKLAGAMGTAAIPQLGTDLRLKWDFSNATVDPTDNNATFGFAPAVSFNNSTLDLGTFFHQFAAPVLGKISTVTAPFKPVIDVLTEKIDLLDDLGFFKTSLLDFLGLPSDSVAVIKGLSDIVSLTNLANGFGGAATIDLGSLNVLGDVRVTPAGALLTSIARAPAAAGSQDATLGNFLNLANNIGGGGLTFPLLQNQKLIGGLLLGQNADLFDYHPAPINFSTGFRQFFPVLGPFGITLGGQIGFSTALDFGFDTQGVRDFALSGNADDVFNGFFARAFDDAGNPSTYVSISAGISAGVAVNLIVVEAGVEGDLRADVLFPFAYNKADATGKVRGNTIANTALADLFTPAGEFSAGLHAYVEVGIDPFSHTFRFDSPREILYTFGQSIGDAPVLINSVPADGSIRLNIGPRAELRLHGNVADVNERFSVSYLAGVPGLRPDLVFVTGMNTTDFVEAATFLVGDGGNFSDVLETTANFPIQTIFNGGSGSDTLISGSADDLLSGGIGNDALFGNGGADTLNGGEGNDVLHGGPGADSFLGGPDFDVASYEFSPVGMIIDLRTMALSGEGAGDTFSSIEGIIGSNFSDGIDGSDAADGILAGLAGDDTISGNGGNDVIDGGAGSDTIYAGDGDDFILTYAGTGNDLIFGGGGIDTVSFEKSSQTTIVNLRTNVGDSNSLLQIENVIGTFLHVGSTGIPETGGDYLVGDDGPNRLVGLSGNDRIEGGGGDDVIYGNEPGAGATIIFGQLPNPDLPGATGFDSDRLFGDAGNDLLDGGDGVDLLEGGPDADRLYGGAGNDEIYGQYKTGDASTGSDDLLDGGEGNDLLVALKGNNQLFGQSGNDTLRSGPGNDLLDGGDGADSLEAGSGNNVVNGGAGDDYIFTLSGNDTIDAGDDNDYVDAQEGNNTIRGGRGHDTLIAVFGNDTIYGDDGNDRIDAGQGLNFLYGGKGNDTITASFNDDTIEGNDDDDTIDAQGGNNTVSGGAGHDSILTSGGNDLLDGGDGNDVIDAGHGTDRLTGGIGDDVLIAGSVRSGTPDLQRTDHLFGGAGVDTITADFSNQTLAMVIVAGADNSLQFPDGAEALNFENLRDFASGSGNDFIRLNGAADNFFQNYLLTGAGHDTVYSGAANDFVDAGDGDDFVDGGSNETVLSFSGGVPSGTAGDTLVGGFGNDTVSFAGIVQFQEGRPLGVRVNLATNATGLGASGTVISGFENVIGTNFRDELTGDAGPNKFYPLRGGGYGTSGGIGDPDRIDGAGGEDTLIIDFSTADLADSLGVVTAGAGFYRNSIGNIEVRDNYGYENIERLDITGASKGDSIYSVTYGFGDVLRGLAGNDTLGGYGGADTLLGGDGNDVLTAQGQFIADYGGTAGGRDFLDGGAGDDSIDDIAIDGFGRQVALSADAFLQLDGGTGFDTLSADFSNHPEAIVWTNAAPANLEFADGAYARNFEQLRHFASGPGNDSLTQLGRVDNRFFTNGGDDIIVPGLGVDAVNGGAGNDVLVLDYSVGDSPTYSGVSGGGSGSALQRNGPGGALLDYVAYTGVERLHLTGTSRADTIFDFSGDDIIFGGAGNDMIASIGGNNYFDGGAGNDTLNGGDGDDFLDGGVGADTMAGGAGSDIYIVDDPADIINEGTSGGYDTVIYTLGGSFTQPANIEKIIFMGSSSLPSLTIGANGIVILGSGAPAPAPPASAAVGAMLAADSGLNEIARWQAQAGTPSDHRPIENTIAALSKITASAAHDTAADIGSAKPMTAFPELFASEFEINADPPQGWHHDASPHEAAHAPFDFHVIDTIV